MKKNYFLLGLLFISLSSFAQTVYEIDWTFGSNSNVDSSLPNHADKTIEVGDIVRWNFVGAGSHTVTSQPSAQESFSSGSVQSAGFVFEHTFTQVGVNDYVCQPHPASMFGTITVVPEGTLSTKEDKLINFQLYPNPVHNMLRVNLPNNVEEVQLTIFNILGKSVKQLNFTKTNASHINTSQLSPGIYLVRISTKDKTGYQKFIKE